jgi:hypothetical protein
METITIQLTNEKAAGLLYELAELKLIRIISSNQSEQQMLLSEKYRGKISPGKAADLHKHIEQMRNEWDRGI